MLQGIGIPQCSLVEQVLQSPAIIKAPVHLRHQLIGNVKGEALALDAAIEHMTGVLFTFTARRAMFADAPRPAEAERSQCCRPESSGLFLEPIRDICGKFSFSWHAVYVPQSTYTVKDICSTEVNQSVASFATETS